MQVSLQVIYNYITGQAVLNFTLQPVNYISNNDYY